MNRRKKTPLGCFVQLESRHCLSAVGFVAHDILTTETRRVTSVLAADVDGDGDLDALSTSALDSKLAWYANLGQGQFAEQQIIDRQEGAQLVRAGDLDNDGDLDVLLRTDEGSRATIAWHENVDGLGQFGAQRVILKMSQGIDFSLIPVDLDHDGDLDILTNSYKDVLWLRNDGSGEFGQPTIVDTAASSTSFTYADDVNGDGRVDILATLEDKIVWYENLDEAVFGPRRIIHQLQSPDSFFSGDGDADVLANTGRVKDSLAWHENLDGQGTFGPRKIIGRHFGNVAPFDLDADGDLDFLMMHNPAVGGAAIKIGLTVRWFENTDGKGNFVFAAPIEVDADSVAIGDLDGDGDNDALLGSYQFDRITWRENTDGKATFDLQHEITASSYGFSSLHGADIDSDGDTDILLNSLRNIFWYEKEGRSFGAQRVITRNHTYADVVPADLDGDSDMDVAVFGRSDSAWFENDGGTFLRHQTFSLTTFHKNDTAFAADVDGDGDTDLVFSKYEEQRVWLENTNGSGSFAGPEPFKGDGPTGEIAVDLDGDGDLDRVTNQAWFENLGGTLGPATFFPSPGLAATGDVDGDGDPDLVRSSEFVFHWYENQFDEGHTFETHPVKQPFDHELPIHRVRRHWEWIHSIDVDGDGDDDILGATLDQIRWFESRPLGDADGNGQFDSADLIHVLSQGRYENGIPASATFDQGDWNGDGVFDSSDFVAVFQAGSYEAAAHEAAAHGTAAHGTAAHGTAAHGTAAHGAGANRRLLTREALARRADEELPVLTRSISAPLQDDSQVEFDTAPH